MAVSLAIILFRNNRRKQTINVILDEKVRERTRQLEESREVLIGTLNKRNILTEKTSDQLRKALASIKGLCEVGLLDIDDPEAAKRCIGGVIVMSDQMALGLRYFHEGVSAAANAVNNSLGLNYSNVSLRFFLYEFKNHANHPIINNLLIVREGTKDRFSKISAPAERRR